MLHTICKAVLLNHNVWILLVDFKNMYPNSHNFLKTKYSSQLFIIIFLWNEQHIDPLSINACVAGYYGLNHKLISCFPPNSRSRYFFLDALFQFFFFNNQRPCIVKRHQIEKEIDSPKIVPPPFAKFLNDTGLLNTFWTKYVWNAKIFIWQHKNS